MRASALVRLGCVAPLLLLPSCTRPNPAYEGTGDSFTGTRGSTGTSFSGDETLGTASGSASGSVAACGNGVVEGTEQCDDGNVVDDGVCSPQCRLSGEVEWVAELDPTGSGPNRFNASVLHQGDLVAVGRGVPESGGPFRAVVVRYALEDGKDRSDAWLFEPWAESEAHAVVGAEGRLFISGAAERPDTTITAFAACFEVLDPDQAPSPCWNVAAAGSSSRAVDVIPSGVLVSVGNFNTAGHGLAVLEPQNGQAQWEWVVDTGNSGGSQFEALARTSDGSLAAGMLDGDAIVAPVTPMPETSLPLFGVSGSGPSEDRVQAMAVLGDELILGGWQSNTGSLDDAWVGRYSVGGTERWSLTIDGGSDDSDEVEDLVIDEAGYVIAVGMLGEPSVATLWKIDPGNGMLLWSRSYPELSDGPSVFRNVETSGDIFVVGEAGAEPNSVGLALRIIP